MYADNKSTNHNRTIKLTNLPGEMKELEITINYTGQGNASKGVCLDGVVIPRIIAAINNPGFQPGDIL